MPALFIVAGVALMLNTLINRPVESIAGIALTLLGVPVYLYWRSHTPTPLADEAEHAKE